jgi:hypothetical protein
MSALGRYGKDAPEACRLSRDQRCRAADKIELFENHELREST